MKFFLNNNKIKIVNYDLAYSLYWSCTMIEITELIL